MEGLLGRSRLGLTESLPFHAFQRLQRGEFIDDNILFAAIAVVMVKTALPKQRSKMVIPSVRSMIASLKYMATVLWQDTIDMAYRKDCFDDKNDCLNPCINKVMQHPDFQKELLIYTSMMDANVFESLRPKGAQEEVALLRQEIRELNGVLRSTMQDIPHIITAAVNQASQQGIQLEAHDFQLAALAPDVAKGVEPPAAEAMAVRQLELATKLALLGENGPIEDAAVAALLGPDSERHEKAFEGFVSPSKVFMERNSGIQPPSAGGAPRKDLSSAFFAGTATNVPQPAAPVASAATTSSNALLSEARQLQPAASSHNIQNAANAGGRVYTFTEAQLQELLRRTQQPIPVAPIMPPAAPAAMPLNVGMPGVPSASSLWPQSAFGAAASSAAGAAAPSMQQPVLPQPQMPPQWQNTNFHTIGSMMAHSTQYGGVQLGPVALQQHINPAFVGAGAPPPPRPSPPYFAQQQAQLPGPGPLLVPSESADAETKIRNLINAKFEEQQQQAARLGAVATDARVLPPFGSCSNIMQNHMKMKMPSVTVEVAARDLEAERNKMGLTMNLWFEQVVLKRGKRSKKKKQQPPEARAEGNDEESGQDDEGDE
ncbi:hypothetical protein Ndes2437A_g05313 [Nannochloris sp. 'desiccata']